MILLIIISELTYNILLLITHSLQYNRYYYLLFHRLIQLLDDIIFDTMMLIHPLPYQRVPLFLDG